MRLSVNYSHNSFSAIVGSIGILEGKKNPYAFRDQPSRFDKIKSILFQNTMGNACFLGYYVQWKKINCE